MSALQSELVRLYRSGKTVVEIATAKKLPEWKVYRHLLMSGAKLRPRGPRSKMRDPKVMSTVKALHRSGHSCRKIAEWLKRKHGVQVTHATVHNWLNPTPWGKPGKRTTPA